MASESSEARIRRYLDTQGGWVQVPFHNLMHTWNVERPTPADCERIQEALRSVGVVAQPALSGLAPESPVVLQVTEAPPAPSWNAPPPAAVRGPAPPARASAAVEDPEELGAIGPSMGAVAAIVAFAGSFLPWVSVFDEGTSLWELADVLDIFLALFALAVVASTIATFLGPELRARRVLTIALMAGLLSFVLVPPIEFMASAEGPVSGTQAGEILALIAAAGLLGAIALQIVDLPRVPTRLPEGSRAIQLLAGLALLCFVGVAQPLVELLPIDTGVSGWEANDVADILGTLIDLAILGVAGAAILGLATPRLVALAFALGSYVAIGTLVGGTEALAEGSNGAGVLISVFLLAPLALAATTLVALGSNLLRHGTRGSARATGPAAGRVSPA